jgi:glycosyltransferase involved in cell wall biosynthesis
MIDATIVICSHNPRSVFLAKVLEALKGQTLDTSRWQLLLIDNCSTPRLGTYVDLSWHPNSSLLYEQQLGLTPCRLRGIREAKSDLIIFVDDDNVLSADFIELAFLTYSSHPFLGAWSGQSLPEFDQTPPEWTRRYWPYLAIRIFETNKWSNLPHISETLPCGAGLCIRRQVGMHYLSIIENGERPFQLDRKGSSLISGGDDDLAACACDVGLGVGLIARLKLAHLIPPERLELDYLSRLVEGISFSSILLAYQRNMVPKAPTLARLSVNCIRRLFMAKEHAVIALAARRGAANAFLLISKGNGRELGDRISHIQNSVPR